MATKIGINGYGRIGRCVHRALLEGKVSGLEIVAVNDITDAKTLAHLLKYDSVHGTLRHDVRAEGSTLIVDGKSIPVYAEKDPEKLPWGQLGATVVLECSGKFTERDGAGKHLKAGAKKVLISAPSKDPDLTVVYGVNHTAYDPAKHHIVSNASCTTNCLAPMAKVVHETAGIVRGQMTTIHAYTNDQRILDQPHKDLRRARAAAMSMIPTTTGAARAVGLVLPELKGKIDGYAVRVPTANVSLVDLTVEVSRKVTAEEINRALRAAAEGPLRGILAYTDDPVVSIDFNGTSVSSTVDGALTKVVGDTCLKVCSWYDNEMGFSHRMLDVLRMMGQ
ncbi:MAG: type I glyceraldehyde-3-phosphate dehydrogenase [Myxococcales bacterium]|nr:type I glyceraldehyde-3-phosphate dehydrogenase [Myxococcales bacterium]